MKISCIQMDMRLADPAYNMYHAEALLRQAAREKPDVLVLPETWNTGFFPRENLGACCDRNGQQVKQRIGGLAREYNVNIVAGSIGNIKNGSVCNTAYVFDRQGNCIADYDKIHLFTPMQEDCYFAPGDHLCTFCLDGITCGIVICYDLRFPELTRSLALQNIEVLFVVSQWPAARISHLTCLSQARAIENQIFVAVCNSCGRAGDTRYGGYSAIVNPWGDVLAQAREEEIILSAVCDMGTIRDIRSNIHVFQDRRPELYQI